MTETDIKKSTKTIMIVEDEFNNLKILMDLFLMERFDVIGVTTIAEAREKIQETPVVDLVLLDLNLPDGFGFSLVEDLYSKYGDSLDIMIITALATPENISIAEKYGINKVIAKPFKVSQLLQEVRQLFSASG